MNAPEVIIIGAGLAGCSVAWHLAGHARILLLEQGAQPGAEASAQNAGMVRRLGEDPYERALAIRTAAFLDDPHEDWADLQPSRVVGAVLGLAHDPAHLHDAVAHLRARGVTVEALKTPATVAPALVGSPLQQIWAVPDERVASAHELVTGFLRGARGRGARLRLNAPVRRLLAEGGRVHGVELVDGERISAERVVLAAGAWSGPLACAVGLRRPLVPLRRTLLMTGAHFSATPTHPWCWIDDEGVYVRPEGEGWLISGCDEAVDPPPAAPGSTGPVAPLNRALAMDKIERLFPALASARPTGGWTGLRTFAPDRRPILGADPELDGLWWAAGLGGYGVTCSYAVGEAVASWMRGQTLDWLDPAGVSPGRRFLSRWPIRPTGQLHRPRLIPAY
ncbi:MAG: FAD-dependent oxidoreductase [Myxococcota bacterium]